MTAEEKAGLMIIGSHFPGDSPPNLANPVSGQVLNEEDVWHSRNPITSQAYPEPILVTSSTHNAINVRHQRFFISRDNQPPRELARWTNAVQEVAEASRLGIPVSFASNPRNHFALVPMFGVSESSGVFSEWPGELGLAALQDPALAEEFGRLLAREFRAGGLHKLYGYMADVASEPRWSRYNGAFGEDPELVSKYIAASIIPYYARPVNESAEQLPKQYWASETRQFEEVAFAYDKVLINGLLRDHLGHSGYVNSDSGIIDAMPWGVESMTKPERFAYAVKAGTDIFSDMSDPSELLEGINQACVRLLSEPFAQGLFENPYVDEEEAARVIGNPEAYELGQQTQRKSVTCCHWTSIPPPRSTPGPRAGPRLTW